MADFNVINLKIDLRKAFDKGKIDQVYLKMYSQAEKIAQLETFNHAKRMDLERSVKPDKNTPIGILLGYKSMENYKKKRIEFHMNQMNKLLELYAKSKSDAHK